MRLSHFILALTLSGCGGSVVRDATVYKSEVKLLGEFSRQQNILLSQWLVNQCTCEAGEFTNALCKDTAEKYALSAARVPWHLDMMLFNAGISETRPSVDPPAPLANSVLCASSTVAKGK